MTYIILEGSHGSGKTTLAGQVQRSPGVFAIPSLFLDVAVRRSMPGGPRSAFHCNDAIKALLAYEAQASGSDIVQDRGYLSTLAHVAFEDSVQVDTPALPGALTWIDAALDLGLLSMPGRVPSEACRAALVLMSLAAGLPVPPMPAAGPAAC